MSKREADSSSSSAAATKDKRQKNCPTSFTRLVREARQVANKKVFWQLAEADLMTRFASEYKTFAKPFEEEVHQAAADLKDASEALLQMAEVQLASRFLKAKDNAEEFLKKDRYALSHDPLKSLKRGVFLLLVGLAANRNVKGDKFVIPANAAVPLDSDTTDLIIENTDTTSCLYVFRDLVEDFAVEKAKHKLPDNEYHMHFDAYVRDVLTETGPSIVPDPDDGFADRVRIQKVIAAIDAKQPFLSVFALRNA